MRKINMMTLEDIRSRFNNGEVFNYLYFWGHHQKGDIPDKSCLSQWFPSPMEIDGIIYPTAEHWMMASKARLFNDEKSLDLILKSTDPKEAKKIGRSVKNFQYDIWEENAKDIVRLGNIQKFQQNKNLLDFLISTDDSILVEASPYDKIWGIGLEAKDVRCANPNHWAGMNWLGFVLMQVREEIV